MHYDLRVRRCGEGKDYAPRPAESMTRVDGVDGLIYFGCLGCDSACGTTFFLSNMLSCSIDQVSLHAIPCNTRAVSNFGTTICVNAAHRE